MNSMRNIYKKLEKLFYLSRADKILLCKAVMLLLVLRVLLKFIPVSKLYRFVKSISKPPRSTQSVFPGYTKSVIYAVEVAGNHIPGSKCLPKALAVHILLNAKGIENKIEIGFIKYKKSFSAHAWVIAKNRVIGESEVKFYFRVPL